MTNHLIFETHPKLILLKEILTPLIEKGLIVAFSGGVDSGFLLWAALQILAVIHQNGQPGRLTALLTVSPSVPSWEVEEAKKFAADLNAPLLIKKSHELEQESYAKNDQLRCYYCKSELFKIAKEEAAQNHYQHIAYGYNASDRKDVRFGHLAAKENNVHAPLEAADLYKMEIREILKQIGLSLAEKPASPCLASRIMTGVRVTEKKLQDIETMESILRNAGLRVYRVRVHEENSNSDKTAGQINYFRIEVSQEEMPTVLTVRDHLVKEARRMGYRWVNLDLSGYQMGGGTLIP